MGIDIAANKVVGFCEKEGLELDGYLSELRYPNGEFIRVADKFLEISKGAIDFTFYFVHDRYVYSYFYDDYEKYIKISRELYNILKELDFEEIAETLEGALSYYDLYKNDFDQCRRYWGFPTGKERDIVEYLLELARQRYYILWDN